VKGPKLTELTLPRREPLEVPRSVSDLVVVVARRSLLQLLVALSLSLYKRPTCPPVWVSLYDLNYLVPPLPSSSHLQQQPALSRLHPSSASPLNPLKRVPPSPVTRLLLLLLLLPSFPRQSKLSPITPRALPLSTRLPPCSSLLKSFAVCCPLCSSTTPPSPAKDENQPTDGFLDALVGSRLVLLQA